MYTGGVIIGGPGGRSLCARGRISGRGAGAVPFYDRYRDHIFRVKDAADAESARQTPPPPGGCDTCIHIYCIHNTYTIYVEANAAIIIIHNAIHMCWI